MSTASISESAPLLKRSPSQADVKPSSPAASKKFARAGTIGALVTLVCFGCFICGSVLGYLGGEFETHAGYRIRAWAHDHLGLAYSGGYQSGLPGPPQVVAGMSTASVNFKLHTQCKSTAVKRARPDFWIEGLDSAYVVKHNYGSSDFFQSYNGVQMTRGKLSDGEYGYTLTTDQVDWEWGFALKNKKGEWFYDIGTANEQTPLAGQNCTQMYWPYFNRMIVAESSRSNVEYVFSDCGVQCPADYVDSTYCPKPFTGLMFQDGGRTNLGPSEDARLIAISSALMYSDDAFNLDPAGRTIAYRDTEFAQTKTEAQWIVATIDYGDRYEGNTGEMGGQNVVKMVRFKVVLDPDGNAYAEQPQNRLYTLGKQCDMLDCYVGLHKIAEIEKDAVDLPAPLYKLSRVEYYSMELGDAPPEQKRMNFYETYGGVYLTNADAGHSILEAGEWGEDLDVRRLIFTFGAICGRGSDASVPDSSSINYDHCMAAKAVIDPDFTATEDEQRWIFVVMDGRDMVDMVTFKMAKASVFMTADKSVKMKMLGAGYVVAPPDVQRGAWDTLDSLYHDIPDAWNRANNNMPISLAPATDDGSTTGYGMGAVDFQLAQEMSASLKSSAGCTRRDPLKIKEEDDEDEEDEEDEEDAPPRVDPSPPRVDDEGPKPQRVDDEGPKPQRVDDEGPKPQMFF